MFRCPIPSTFLTSCLSSSVSPDKLPMYFDKNITFPEENFFMFCRFWVLLVLVLALVWNVRVWYRFGWFYALTTLLQFWKLPFGLRSNLYPAFGSFGNESTNISLCYSFVVVLPWPLSRLATPDVYSTVFGQSFLWLWSVWFLDCRSLSRSCNGYLHNAIAFFDKSRKTACTIKIDFWKTSFQPLLFQRS